MLTLSRNFHKLGLGLLLGCLLAGCGGGKSGITNVGSSNSSLLTASPSDSVLLTLSSGTASDVSPFNGDSIYALVTAEPSGKPEGNNSPSTTYAFALSSTAGSSTDNITLNSVKNKSTFFSNSKALFSKTQIASDNKFRAKENELLASKAKQFSKGSSSVLKAIAPTGNIAVNDSWKGVWVNDVQIDTTCCYVSDYAYIFVDKRDISKLSLHVKEYGEAFDKIYQNNHKYFGKENDVDRNGKVIIVFSEALSGGYLGYFYAVDKYEWDATSNPYSNQGDIIYITADSDYLDYVKETMAHEFQHMIYFDQHYNEGVSTTYTWLNEALSQAAQYYNYGVEADTHEAYINSFLNNSQYYAYSGLSLTYWTDNNYGFGAIFIRYIIDQYGDTAIKKMCSPSLVGITAVEYATGVDFNTLFTNFTRALVLLGTGYTSSNKEYNFTSTDLTSLRMTPLTDKLAAEGAGITGEIYPYSINYYSCSGTFGTMTLSGTSVSGTVFGLSK